MIQIDLGPILQMIEAWKKAQKNEGRSSKKSRERFKQLLLQKARENVSGASLAGGRQLHRRTGSLYAGIRVTESNGQFAIESKARRNGVNYGEVLNAGAVIYPRQANGVLVFRVPSSAKARKGFGANATQVIFAKKVTIPAFGWKDKAWQDAVEQMAREIDVLGGDT